VNWGDGAGRAPAVREPPPNFIDCMRKTASARAAAKEMFAAQSPTAEAMALKPAFDAVLTFEELRDHEGEPVTDMSSLIYPVTTVIDQAPDPITPKFIERVMTEVTFWVLTDQGKGNVLVNIAPRGVAPEPTVLANGDVFSLFPKLGVLTNLAQNVLVSAEIEKFPTGTMLWSTRISAPVQVEDLVQHRRRATLTRLTDAAPTIRMRPRTKDPPAQNSGNNDVEEARGGGEARGETTSPSKSR